MKVARLRWRATVLAVALGGVLVAVPSVSFAYPGCGHSTVARDYLAQVKRAAPIREVPKLGDPSSRQLPFAPTGLRLQVSGIDLMIKSSEVGFSLDNFFGARRLDWIVESELVKVNAQGEDIKSLGVKRRVIGTFKGGTVINLLHRVSANPAYYRVDIRFFHKGADRVLGQYSSYARVMKPRVDLRVKIERFTVVPGEVARASLWNLGTVPLITPSYTYGFIVQTFTDEGWIGVPDNPPRRIPKLLRPWMLSAGMENRGCLRYLVPSDQAPGLFRFVSYGAETDDVSLIAEFQVASSP